MNGILRVAALKRDPHAPADRSERDASLFRAGSFTKTNCAGAEIDEIAWWLSKYW